MATKHFILNPHSSPSSQEDIMEVEQIRTKKLADTWEQERKKQPKPLKKNHS